MSPTVIFGLLLLEVGLCFGALDWSYRGTNGPTSWAKSYPNCTGNRQSPILLKVLKASDKPLLTWSGFDDTPDSMVLHNDGRTVQLSSEGAAPNITTGAGKVYELANVRFHWGENDSEGSEHKLDRRRFPMEMQAQYQRVDNEYDSATKFDMLIIATFLQLKPTDGNKGISKLADDLHKVIHEDTTIPITPFPWSELLQPFKGDFIWYEGSLTTPPCSEGVTFIVKREPNFMTNAQMDQFRQLVDENDQPISGNFRPLQRRQYRPIYFKVA